MARICLIRQGDYPLDPRVLHEVQALVDAGHDVDVICLRRPGEPAFERNGRVTVRRLPVPRQRRGFAWYLGQYAAFLALAGMLAAARHLRRRYDLVQVNTLPDTLVFAGLVPRLLGARVLLDLPECMPEFFASKFGWPAGHPAVRWVTRAERAAIRFADFAITCTEPMRQTFIARGAPPEKIATILNSYGLGYGAQAPARPRGGGSDDGAFELICHGSIEERYGLDTLVRATALVRSDIPEVRVRIFGNGSYRPALEALIAELGLGDRVQLSPGWVPMPELLAAIAAADVGVVAIRRDPYRDLVLCTKLFDFIGLDRPVIASRTSSLEEYFDAGCFELFTAGDPEDLARAIRRLHADPARRRRLAERARSVSERYSWVRQRGAYQGIVDSLLQSRRPMAVVTPGRARDEGVGP